MVLLIYDSYNSKTKAGFKKKKKNCTDIHIWLKGVPLLYL